MAISPPMTFRCAVSRIDHLGLSGRSFQYHAGASPAGVRVRSLQPFLFLELVHSGSSKEVTIMRAALTIATLVGLLLLAFSPVWYGAIAGEDRVIVDSNAVATQ